MPGCQLICFLVIKEKTAWGGGGGGVKLFPTEIRVKAFFLKLEVDIRFKALHSESNTKYCIVGIHQ